jgi:hypothetical protein
VREANITPTEARRRLLAAYRLLLEAADDDTGDEIEKKRKPGKAGPDREIGTRRDV